MKHAGRRLVALLCLGGLVQACQSILVFTPDPISQGGDAAPADAALADVAADDARAPDATFATDAEGCTRFADAAFCVDFSAPADLSVPVWSGVDPGVTLTTQGATSPPFAARMESTSTGPSCEYQTLRRQLPARDTTRLRLVANVSSTTEGFSIGMSVAQSTEPLVLLAGIFSGQLKIIAQQAYDDGTWAPVPTLPPGEVHTVEMVVQRTADRLSVTFRLLDVAGYQATMPLPATIALGQVEIIVGVWNQCQPTVVTTDDIAFWFD